MKVNERKAGVIISYVQIFAGIISMLIYTPFMLKLMGQSEYGIYNLAQSLVSYLAVLDFGCQSTYTRFYMKYKTAGDTEGVKRINGTFLLMFLCFSLLAIIAGAIVTSNAHLIFSEKLTALEIKKTKIVMGIMVFNIAATFPSKNNLHIRLVSVGRRLERTDITPAPPSERQGSTSSSLPE